MLRMVTPSQGREPTPRNAFGRSTPTSGRLAKKHLVFVVVGTKAYAIVCIDQKPAGAPSLPGLPGEYHPVKLSLPNSQEELSRRTYEELTGILNERVESWIAGIQVPKILAEAQFVFVLKDLDQRGARIVENNALKAEFIHALFTHDDNALQMMAYGGVDVTIG